MKKVFGAIVVFSFIAGISTSVMADEMVSLKLGYMMLSPSGEFTAEENGFGTKIDIESDLGAEDSENMMVEAAFNIGDIKLSANYMPLSFEGDSILSRSILFNGQLYTFGSRVVSNLDMDILDLGLTYYFINMDDAPTRFQLGVELSTKITDAEALIKDVATGVEESASETLPLPTIGLRGRVAFSDFVGINGRIGYLGYSDNHFLDADVQIEVSPIPLLGLFAGYRHIDIAIDESDIFVDTEFSGFYGGAFFRF